MNPKLSIIIPTLNEEKYLPNLLQDLQNQTFQDFEVIVADAHSKDTTRAIAKEFGARIVDGGLPGIARNAGAKKSRSDILLFLDADIRIDSHFIQKTVNSFVEKQVDCATTKYSYRNETAIGRIENFFWNNTIQMRQFTKRPWGTGQCIIISKNLFNELGGFNEKMEISEDVDILQRASQKGVFRVINTYYSHSKRRYDSFGKWRIYTAYLANTMLNPKKTLNSSSESLITRLYGGWGRW